MKRMLLLFMFGISTTGLNAMQRGGGADPGLVFTRADVEAAKQAKQTKEQINYQTRRIASLQQENGQITQQLDTIIREGTESIKASESKFNACAKSLESQTAALEGKQNEITELRRNNATIARQFREQAGALSRCEQNLGITNTSAQTNSRDLENCQHELRFAKDDKEMCETKLSNCSAQVVELESNIRDCKQELTKEQAATQEERAGTPRTLHPFYALIEQGLEHGEVEPHLAAEGSTSEQSSTKKATNMFETIPPKKDTIALHGGKALPEGKHEKPALWSRRIGLGQPADGKILLLTVHGTTSSGNSFGIEDDRLTTKEIIKFANVLAQTHKQPVEILIFEWSGKLDRADRINAGNQLADWINIELEKIPNTKLWTIAHSHGCNVVNNMANKLRDQYNKTINVGIQIASPKLDQPLFDPAQPLTDESFLKTYNFEKGYWFYSTGDVTQVLGSAEQLKWYGFKPNENLFSADRKVPLPILYHKDRKVWNIRVQDGNYEPDHILVKMSVLANLPGLLYKIDTDYPIFSDLDAAVFRNPLIDKFPEKLAPLKAALEKSTSPDKFPLVAIRDRRSLQQGSVSREVILRALNESRNEKATYEALYNTELSAKRTEGVWKTLMGEYGSTKLKGV